MEELAREGPDRRYEGDRQRLRGRAEAIRVTGDESVLAVTCGFRFEVRPEDEIVELQADHHTAHVVWTV